jgi:hypothetical protein
MGGRIMKKNPTIAQIPDQIGINRPSIVKLIHPPVSGVI